MLNGWIQFNYVQTKSLNLFATNYFDWISCRQILFSRKLFTLILSNKFIKNNFYLQENDFYLPLLGNELLQFYLQKYLNLIFIYKKINLFINFIHKNIFNSILS